MNGGSWDATIEGSQNFASYSDQGDMPQDSEENTYQANSMEEYQSKWNLPPAMHRTVSRSSAGSYKNRTVRAPARRTRPGIPTELSQGAPTSAFDASVSASMSAAGYGMTDAFSANSTMATAMTSVPSVGQNYFPDASMGPSNQMLQQQYFPSLYQPSLESTYSPDGLAYVGDLGTGLDQPVQQHVDPACTQMHFEPSVLSSPLTIDTRSSRRSSLDMAPEDMWSYRPESSSPAESHDSTMSSFGPLPGAEEPMHSAMASDFSGSATMRQRSSSESDTVRDHPLYKEAIADDDGLYHCPWESESNCNHKPEKLKCNYDKFVDSHLKPYRCKNQMCENTRFSSTACLLRHEREAHAMHGHGDKPYRCTYDGCERSTMGNGFPRQWNLKDHMRRVHHDESLQMAAAATLPSPPRTSSSSHSLSKNRKRKKDSLSGHVTAGSLPSRKASSRGKGQHNAAAEADSSRSQAQMQAAAAKAQLDQSFKMWSEHTATLRDIVGNFSQPYALQTFQQLQDARTHLSFLEQIHTAMAQSQSAADLGIYGHSQQLG
ncbi:c2h2 finger domain containing protein [Grosmannia clavigera kw1407]|uniref:C2h2 finger domain containing protein n=1 Tax=Grosmannia clavigera (strain kw1407 / UAMH 11150) TaxID=655863 RepID=F0XAG8_GROCL|nr:c2h2 finger domain containing protein [Grosmannia clavigera kw1407]EFX06137.1 c2h2 finger domain containing protein [Grosmannia clavigera kw1407]